MFLFDIPISGEILKVFLWFSGVYLADTKANKPTDFPVINDDVV